MLTKYTDRQVEINKVINDLFHLETEMEHEVGEFSIDIWVFAFGLAIEIQGPQHYRKKTERREAKLREYGIKNFLYIPIHYTNQQFIDEFMGKLGELELEILKGDIIEKRIS